MKRLICWLMLLLLPLTTLAEDNHYEAVGFYGEYDMCPVRRDGKWGFIDHAGQLILPCEWDDISAVVNGIVPVQRDGKWGAINRAGDLIVPCQWQRIAVNMDGTFNVTDFNGYDGALAADGSVLIPCDRYEFVGPVINGARRICTDGLWGLCTETGEIITPCQWHSTGYFYEGLAWVYEPEYGYGYINEQGEVVIPMEYSHLADFVQGSAAVRFRNGKWQLMDPRGRFLCEKPWDEMEQFPSGNLIMVMKDGKYGFINHKGEVVIAPQYDKAKGFEDGLAYVRQGDAAFWIDESGAKVVERPAGHTAWQFYGDYACLRNAEGLYGVMDRSGAFIIPCEWPDGMINPFSRGEITCMWTETHYAFFNKQGALVTGKLHERGNFEYALQGEYLFLIEGGELTIWHADGTKTY